MKKLMAILTLLAIVFYAEAQESSKVKNSDDQKQVKPKLAAQPNPELVIANSSNIRVLSPDNMPCLVPKRSNLAPMPNAFSSQKALPYMPNSIPQNKKTPSR